MNKIIDYFLFPNSPYAYMGHARLAAIAQRHGAAIRVRPMDAAKVFPVSGGLPLAQRPKQRVAYRMTELKRWRDFLGLPMHVEPKFFPVAAGAAAALIVAAEEISPKAAFDLAGRVLAAVWEQERNIADEATLTALAGEAGLDSTALLARSKAPDIQARYDAYTQEAIDRQIFGAPTYVYNDELFWGQDRLDFLERALAK
jgi:2-hydroxychromene-2-carboxylate isomerase